MKVIVIEEFGGPDAFKEADVPKPELRDGHLLVRVVASSVNPVDYKVRAGLIPPITPEFPAVLGCDVAGVVEEIGAGVADFSAGDEVYFCAGSPAGIGGAGFDVVFDTVGGDNIARSIEATGLNGQVVSVNTRCEVDLSPLHMRGLSLHVVFMLIPMFFDQAEGKAHHGEILRELAQHVEAGKMKPLVHEEVFGFADVGRAHALLENGGAVGKIVLRGW